MRSLRKFLIEIHTTMVTNVIGNDTSTDTTITQVGNKLSMQTFTTEGNNISLLTNMEKTSEDEKKIYYSYEHYQNHDNKDNDDSEYKGSNSIIKSRYNH